MKLLLDMYRGVNRDKRENMELICVEKKLKTDIEETKVQMRRILVCNSVIRDWIVFDVLCIEEQSSAQDVEIIFGDELVKLGCKVYILRFLCSQNTCSAFLKNDQTRKGFWD